MVRCRTLDKLLLCLRQGIVYNLQQMWIAKIILVLLFDPLALSEIQRGIKQGASHMTLNIIKSKLGLGNE